MKKDVVFQIDLSKEFEALPRAPVVEAVIHWSAKFVKEWEPVVLEQRLKELLPDYPESERSHFREVELLHSADAPPSAGTIREGWHCIRIKSNLNPYIAQFNRDGLVFSRLHPYTGWDDFSREASRVWNIYCSVAEPTEIHRLGVRYISQPCAGELF